MSFQDVREALFFSFADGFISEEQFIILHEEYKSVNLCFPYREYESFNLQNLDDSECKAEFRVEKGDIPILADALQIPDHFRCPQSTICPGLEGLCLLLRRLAYPCHYFDLIHRFARPVPELCMIANIVLEWIYDTHGHRLTFWNNQPFLSSANLECYAQAITRMGSPLTNCFGFINGTVRQISRPGENQRIVFNGHKRVHALKFQSVIIPNGLVANLYGPVEGRRNDAGMLKESDLLNVLKRQAYTPRGDALCLYGDPAYPLCPHMMGPYREAVLTPDMRAFNTAMSELHVSVEWIFGDIAEYFKFIDYKKNLKIGMSAVAKQYIVSALFRNILTCLYGNTTSKFFQLEPPSLLEYLP